MVRILSLETSTTVCSVALHENNSLVAVAEVHLEHSHASKLAQLIDTVVKISGFSLAELDAVAVSSGPGSYTGLRIGTSTAKGICFALNVPLIAINTLAVLSEQMNKTNTEKSLLCPMIDARRMEVYCLITDAKGSVVQEVEARVIDEKSFEDLLNEHRMIFFGNGAEKCRSVITHNNAFFVEGVTPSAVQLGSMACRKFERAEFEDLFHFEPFYLKEFKAKKPSNFLDAANKTS
ncbi:MAG TPA: tRNA (adenosine(37)-N6)-threonylcarbamoyltransferase complex dimerization subunit type 1 TsaB [Chryseolinea sp.]